MAYFKNNELTSEEAFWVMFYFLKEHYDLSGDKFDISDILSASEPIGFAENNSINFEKPDQGKLKPIDSEMVSHWNNAIEKYLKEGAPKPKSFK